MAGHGTVSFAKFNRVFRAAYPQGWRVDAAGWPMAEAQKMYGVLRGKNPLRLCALPAGVNQLEFNSACFVMMSDELFRTGFASTQQEFSARQVYDQIVLGRVFKAQRTDPVYKRIRIEELETAAFSYLDLFAQLNCGPSGEITPEMAESLPGFYLSSFKPPGRRLGISIPAGEIRYFIPAYDEDYGLRLVVLDQRERPVQTLVIDQARLRRFDLNDRIFEDIRDRRKKDFEENNQKLLSQAEQARQKEVLEQLKELTRRWQIFLERQDPESKKAAAEDLEIPIGDFLVAGPATELTWETTYSGSDGCEYCREIGFNFLDLRPGKVYRARCHVTGKGAIKQYEVDFFDQEEQLKPNDVRHYIFDLLNNNFKRIFGSYKIDNKGRLRLPAQIIRHYRDQ